MHCRKHRGFKNEQTFQVKLQHGCDKREHTHSFSLTHTHHTRECGDVNTVVG